MHNLRNLLVITVLTIFSLFLTQTAEAQKRKLVGGKDLVITWGELVANGKITNNRAPYKVNFKVRNYGMQNVQNRTRVALQLVQYPLNNNNGSVIKDYLLNAPMGDVHFETNPLASNQEQAYTAYIPRGLPVGYRYQVELKVDACLNQRDAESCRVEETIEDNNHYRLKDLILNFPLKTTSSSIPTDLPNSNFNIPVFNPQGNNALVNGKDLRITWGETIPNGAVRNNRAPYKINFKVKNFGTQDVAARTQVVLNLVQYPLDNNNGRVMTSLLADREGSNYDNFETTPLASGQERPFTAHIPNGLPTGYRYKMEIKVDGCMGERDDAPCRVNESSEINNHLELPELRVQ